MSTNNNLEKIQKELIELSQEITKVSKKLEIALDGLEDYTKEIKNESM